MDVKEEFWNCGYVDRFMKKQKYTIAQGYKCLIGEQDRVQWAEQVWRRINFPKHSFVCKLSVQEKLLTKERIANFLQLDNKNCEFCGVRKRTMHTYFFNVRRQRNGWKQFRNGWDGTQKRLT